MTDPSVYTVGGTVQAGGGIYISRQADEELLNLCRTATFAYVLTPRQMGKSSLMVRTSQTLTQEEITSVIIDLQEFGTQVTAEQWYFGLLVKIEDQLTLKTDAISWWLEHQYLGFSQRLTLFFEQVLLTEIDGQVVIFVDEIDSTLSLEFTDDFFIVIRYLYGARATNPEFQRLSFVLLGVATPRELIRDPKRTPFNIGHRIDLTDFTFEEALPLADRLGLPINEAQQVLQWVLKWTGGHPYLTQRLFSAILAELKEDFVIEKHKGKKNNNSFDSSTTFYFYFSEADIDRIVRTIFFGVRSKQDNNLQFVHDMLTRRAPDQNSVLKIYENIYRGKHFIHDEEQSIFKSHLKLSGIIRTENNVLYVRNLIYKKVFNDKWIKENFLTKSWTLEQKIAYGYFITIGLGFFGFLTGLTIANYYRGREARIFNQAQEERQLLNDYNDAVVRAQLHSSNIVVFLEDSQRLPIQKSEFLRNVKQAETGEAKIAMFITSNPKDLAATGENLTALLQDCDYYLSSYVKQIHSVVAEIQQPIPPQQAAVVKAKLLEIMRGETAMQLDQLSEKLSNILRTAEAKERQRQTDVEEAKGVERLIVMVSMLVSVAIAAIVAWRTSRVLGMESKKKN